ncbi:MAG: hypothetical protein LQ346_006660 [Caloplaca aetnensis]|nr:MAG: hypothetical protein LQ346_006660 [Caloplaca aetnensis]
MWLLNTSTLALHNFITQDVEQYAILSHTWGDEEVSFQDMTVQSNLQAPLLADLVYDWCGRLVPWSRLKQRKGYKKVERCCAEALAHGYNWVWVDTVCIDKKSSAELSEAINSMYDWYDKAAVCYAYMSDVSMTAEGLDATVIDAFKSSRWFRRGWTLQELLAPSKIIFYDKDWRCLGSRARLANYITSATGIHQRYLRSKIPCASASIATRMSWAAHRSTTRVEDEAYCLLGLFQINMSLLYGEGSRAFLRLQHEIIRNSDDESIFAWYADKNFSGIFAKGPSAFTGCGDYFPYEEPQFTRTPYTMTNRGLSLDAVYRMPSEKCNDRLGTQSITRCVLLPLNCTSKYLRNKPVTIILQRISQDVYVRYLAGEVVDPDTYCNSLFETTNRTTIYVRDPVYNERWYTQNSKIRTHFVGKFYEGLVIFDRHSLECYATDEWFISPPGRIISPNRIEADDWKLRLSGWSGFAVLTIKDNDQNPVRIAITYKHITDFGPALSLCLPGPSETVSGVIEACFDQHEERKRSLKLDKEHTLHIGGGKVVALKQRIIDNRECYVLSIDTV